MDENEIENSVLLALLPYTLYPSISSERKRDYTCELWRTETSQGEVWIRARRALLELSFPLTGRVCARRLDMKEPRLPRWVRVVVWYRCGFPLLHSTRCCDSVVTRW